MAGEGESSSSSAEQEAETANSVPRGKRASNAFLNELKRKSGYGVEGEISTSPTAKRSRRHRSTSPADAGLRDVVDETTAPVLIEVGHGASPPARSFSLDDGTTIVGGEDDPEERRGFSNMRNPLASGPSKFLTDATGRRRWLGPSSTWAYSRQVLNMIQGHLGQHESPEVPLNVDAEAFKLDWPSSRGITPQATVDIPSLDYALYLTNTVKFHLGQTYHLFDEESFMTGLYDLYRTGPKLEPTVGSRLWYIQFLIIMAFGKALLVPGNPNQTPPGSDLVTRALELLPDVHGLYQDPVLSVEILCGLALYLQSVDHRNSAYTYIGQAFRIAVSQGLHREPLRDQLNDSEANRLRCVWWTLYILDRKMSSLMGAPNSIQDSDITVQLPRSDPVVHKYKALGIHVVLSQLLAKVLNTVYGVDGKLDPSFLKSVQEVLRDMARLAPQLTAGFEFKFNNSEPASRVSATLNLCYHQCVVLATRPILMCLLQDVLGRRGNLNRGLASPIKALLKTSSDSANKSLRILSTLQSQHLLESFLPFDLEQAFSSAFVLTLMTSMPSLSERDNRYMQTTTDILDTMIARGNVVARCRKEELEKLQEMLCLAQRQLHAPPSVAGDGSSGMQAENQSSLRIDAGDLSLPTEQPTEAGPAIGSTTNGLASEQMLSIAGLLDWEPNMAAFDDDQLAGSWLWTEAIAPDFDFSGGLL
ncbi:hypothetical protein CPAR01_07326 [Colletotrichum paranaense]|uniref:Xylanolytic transcriptional activator regulatory domain-containing protein n=1 Tax=Colletotrichum paranaense TaxID=1914294 RepID=A0ABQ9SP93_9PEZI|nr:uncharacterized protein CPAR01_07326 [Colletotrichum paranaense]KAK1541337.1 hypothetical protein CPAR01_07326 [Colletotrichum paranaense]